eukprot:GHVN01066940.1.p1 GENE.GHVN01066940.1~~GHVN01066940.1.p1  ORF type:complete len:1508 (-),score=283.92 GHVN01066940.1:7776-12272(-)
MSHLGKLRQPNTEPPENPALAGEDVCVPRKCDSGDIESGCPPYRLTPGRPKGEIDGGVKEDGDDLRLAKPRVKKENKKSLSARRPVLSEDEYNRQLLEAKRAILSSTAADSELITNEIRQQLHTINTIASNKRRATHTRDSYTPTWLRGGRRPFTEVDGGKGGELKVGSVWRRGKGRGVARGPASIDEYPSTPAETPEQLAPPNLLTMGRSINTQGAPCIVTDLQLDARANKQVSTSDYYDAMFEEAHSCVPIPDGRDCNDLVEDEALKKLLEAKAEAKSLLISRRTKLKARVAKAAVMMNRLKTTPFNRDTLLSFPEQMRETLCLVFLCLALEEVDRALSFEGDMIKWAHNLIEAIASLLNLSQPSIKYLINMVRVRAELGKDNFKGTITIAPLLSSIINYCSGTFQRVVDIQHREYLSHCTDSSSHDESSILTDETRSTDDRQRPKEASSSPTTLLTSLPSKSLSPSCPPTPTTSTSSAPSRRPSRSATTTLPQRTRNASTSLRKAHTIVGVEESRGSEAAYTGFNGDGGAGARRKAPRGGFTSVWKWAASFNTRSLAPSPPATPRTVNVISPTLQSPPPLSSPSSVSALRSPPPHKRAPMGTVANSPQKIHVPRGPTVQLVEPPITFPVLRQAPRSSRNGGAQSPPTTQQRLVPSRRRSASNEQSTRPPAQLSTNDGSTFNSTENTILRSGRRVRSSSAAPFNEPETSYSSSSSMFEKLRKIIAPVEQHSQPTTPSNPGESGDINAIESLDEQGASRASLVTHDTSHTSPLPPETDLVGHNTVRVPPLPTDGSTVSDVGKFFNRGSGEGDGDGQRDHQSSCESAGGSQFAHDMDLSECHHESDAEDDVTASTARSYVCMFSAAAERQALHIGPQPSHQNFYSSAPQQPLESGPCEVASRSKPTREGSGARVHTHGGFHTPWAGEVECDAGREVNTGSAALGLMTLDGGVDLTLGEGLETDAPSGVVLLLRDVMILLLVSGKFDARVQNVFVKLSFLLSVDPILFSPIQDAFAIALAKTMQEEFRADKKTGLEMQGKRKKTLKLTAISIRVGAAAAITAGLAPPVLATDNRSPGLASIGGFTAFIRSTGGAALVGSLFGAGSAGLTGYPSGKRLGRIKRFEFTRVNENKVHWIGNLIKLHQRQMAQRQMITPPSSAVLGVGGGDDGDATAVPGEGGWIEGEIKDGGPERARQQQGRGRSGGTGEQISEVGEDETVADFGQPEGPETPSYMHLCICLSGWVGCEEDFILPWVASLHDAWYDLHTVLWEPRILSNLGLMVYKLVSEKFAMDAAKLCLMWSTAATFSLTLAWPKAMLVYASKMDSVWLSSKEKAQQAGSLLAEVLSDPNVVGQRPITLIGYSVGARVMFYALKELHRRKKVNSIRDVVFMGLPMCKAAKSWAKIQEVTSGRVVNVYSRSDWVLAVLYRYVDWGTDVAGLGPIEGVENYDVTGIVESHFHYRDKVRDILTYTEIHHSSNIFDNSDPMKANFDPSVPISRV